MSILASKAASKIAAVCLVSAALSSFPSKAEASGFFSDVAQQVSASLSFSQNNLEAKDAFLQSQAEPQQYPADVKAVPIAARDMVIAEGKIYVSVTEPPSIAVIDPVTASVERTIYLEDPPAELAVSDDGKYLYVVLKVPGLWWGNASPDKVARFLLPSLQKDIEFSLGTDEFSRKYMVRDIKVLPGEPESIIISRLRFYYPDYSYGGVVIYDNDRKRGSEISGENGPSMLEVGQEGTCYGLGGLWPLSFYRLDVNDDGVFVRDATVGSDFSWNDLRHVGGKIFTNNGEIIDPSGPSLIGKVMPPSDSAVLPDVKGERIYFVAPQPLSGHEVYAYHLLTHRLLGVAKLPKNYEIGPYDSQVGSLIRWSDTGFAFRLSKSVVITTSPILMPPDGSDLVLTEAETGDPAQIVYEVLNEGPSTAVGITATVDVGNIPVAAASATGGSCATGEKVICTFASIAAKESRRITVTVINYGRNFSRNATVAASSPEPDRSNNRSEFLYLNNYFPLVPGYSWLYRTSAGAVVTQYVLPKGEKVGNRLTYVLANKGNGYREYYSAAADGILLHRQYVPGFQVEGVGRFNVTLTYDPPLRLANSDFKVGETFGSYGTVYGRAKRVADEAPYEAVFTTEKARVTVPRGEYDAIKISGTLSIRGVGKPLQFFLVPDIGIVRAEDSSGYMELVDTNVDFHNFTVQSITAPKTVVLARGKAKTAKVSVKIQNKSKHAEYITSRSSYEELVTLLPKSLGVCSDAQTALVFPKKYPVVIKPSGSLTLSWNVLFNCANDAAANTKASPGHFDYAFSARVTHAALEGIADNVQQDDVCPRPTSGGDAGCGSKRFDGTYGGDVLTDVVIR